MTAQLQDKRRRIGATYQFSHAVLGLLASNMLSTHMIRQQKSMGSRKIADLAMLLIVILQRRVYFSIFVTLLKLAVRVLEQ